MPQMHVDEFHPHFCNLVGYEVQHCVSESTLLWTLTIGNKQEASKSVSVSYLQKCSFTSIPAGRTKSYCNAILAQICLPECC